MLLRDALGETLRDARTRQNRTLRDVSTAANVSLGYLSEVERGRKEASSELLASICDALDIELAEVLDTVSETIRLDTVPVRAELTANSVKAQNRRPMPYGLDKALGDKVSVGDRHFGRSTNLQPTPAQPAAARQLRIVLPYGRAEAPVN
ncbi:helix-turn-helix domain-containing protein [Nakamurella lactea]|uniref:helix-turn-helix domain-containing protein n=1 Tax=Nakamurella lactea TaxID=459515 RepID=UPI00040883D1|nr:helix-turn-helix transcriptional regulator [Nakamurella lactea]